MGSGEGKQMTLSTTLDLEGERRYDSLYRGLGGDWRHLNPDGRGQQRGKGEMPGRKSMMAGPRCSGWKARMGSSSLGQLTDPEMKIKGTWFIWEVQGHQ